MNGVRRTWLTVDTDDVRHVPSNQGHPTRSKPNNALPQISNQFKQGFQQFHVWMSTHQHPVTLFVIADQCESDEFVDMINRLCATYGERISIGCHGLHHRSWSAWPKDVERFSMDLATSVGILEAQFPNHFRRWFRAPAGYIASWMIPILEQHISSLTLPSILHGWSTKNTVKANHGKQSNQRFRRVPSPNDLGRRGCPYQRVALPSTFPVCVGMQKAPGNDWQHHWLRVRLISLKMLESNSIPCIGTFSIMRETTDDGRLQSKACDVCSVG